MRTRLTSRISLLFMAFALLLALPAMAFADTLQINNTLVVGSNVSKDPGQSGTGKVWLDPSDNSTDTQNGCNATTSAPVTVTFTSSDTSKIANPAPVTLTDCGTTKAADFSYSVASTATAGTVQISGAVSGGRGGTYNTSDTLTVTINAPAKADTSISNVSGSGTYGGNATLTAKLSSGANNLSGKNVAFELNGQSVGTDATDANGVAELSGVSLSGINAGTYNNAVSANFTGDSGYNGSSGLGTLTVNKADATIQVNGFQGTYDGNAHGASGSATGVNSEDLSSLLNLGASFTNVPGGTANWSFAGNGNYNSDSGTAAIVINKADATVQLSGLGSYFYDGTPKVATATTSNPSGLNVTITYNGSPTAPTTVGSYNVVATIDNPNYQGQATGTLVIKPWTLNGFYQPVDMGDVLNTVKNGATVPLKFELFSGTTELTSTSAVSSVTAKTVACGAFTGDPTDEIEMVTTGGTSLRYDSTGGQFIYNWQTPKKPNTCYNVTMTATDGSTLTAYFKLR
jgi:hypothetical protein